ncbi:hypothetical protein [Streptomyces anthocyanicus]|uniref:hypothetical protein n=1 Tax=Streptomyces anthocyanicus TaxID=68174 RepID=UPI00386AECE7|nr:hypothetical protein OH747_05260 [Streptomyces anthocyanicus]
MSVIASPVGARGIRFVLIVGFACKRYPGGNLAVPEGVDAHTFAVTEAAKLAASHPSRWVLWTEGGKPIIFPADQVQRIETEYLDRA